MSEATKPIISSKSIIENAITVMTGRLDSKDEKSFTKGLAAYDAWKKAILNKSDFPTNAILPILAERLMCHGDAMDCLADGRHNAAMFMRRLAGEFPDYKDLCMRAGEQFHKVSSIVWKMADVLGGYARDEKQMLNLGKPEVRQQLAMLIDECKIADSKALEALVELKNSI